ncbi:class I SAM-dependent methyltransferase [Calidifontibacter sp. DB0510]|uniref:Class I SAM-dependent methyltransferase n=1 Tax=Metallococcus carri TaxID=1656884 RepID=A0A967AZT5_9MICO|nr:cyclopropane-fatty-acyl-phospholipid synthase family protein [Metallococcus carri]NHN56144.1 class I SAM-dependent methyltransferase [Metallococcus carri]NOP38805.1 class I SAM-dependent methyltransferase [Calidifontibacter sp. DB2511S]
MTTADLPAALQLPRPRAALSGAVARRLAHVALAGVPVRMRYPDGREVGGGGPDAPVLQLVRPRAVFQRLEAHPKIGLGEAYMAGDWTAADGTDLAQLLMPFAARLSTILPRPLMRMRAIVDRALPAAQRNTLTGSRANIEAHYDLSNDLFAAFLDETMTYSSAWFAGDTPWEQQSLAEAQRRKIDLLLDRAGVGAGTRVLEIGTGWGELAVRAASRGARVTTITLSREQRELARRRIAAAGLTDRVDVRLQDYREVDGRYDAVVSVEMIEAVGEDYWPTYFRTLDERLAPGGTVVLQAILMDHQRLLATRNSFGWIQKYIFPGGLIPSLQAIEEVSGRHTSLQVADSAHFGAHYAETLRRWRETFLDAWPKVRDGGFDETFRRMWEFYLAYCEAGFAVGYLDVAQLTLRRA